jgi:hypothetical protein
VKDIDLRQRAGPGCMLDAGGWERQRERMHRLRRHVERVDEDGEVLRIVFDPAVDRALVDDFIATEGVCCGFLSLGYDDGERTLRIRSDDDQSWDVVRGFGAVFSGSAA